MLSSCSNVTQRNVLNRFLALRRGWMEGGGRGGGIDPGERGLEYFEAYLLIWVEVERVEGGGLSFPSKVPL